MNLHIFNDPNGFTLNLTVKRFADKNMLGQNLFINLNRKTKYRDERVTYLKKSIPAFRSAIRKLPPIKSLNFYPFDHVASFFLKEFRKVQPGVSTGWIFWSYEYYHRPDIYPGCLDSFSRRYYQPQYSWIDRQKISFRNIVKKALMIPVFDKKLLDSGYSSIDHFFSFLPQDYRNVAAATLSQNWEYHRLSFLSIEDIAPGVAEPGINLTDKIMVGHAANITANHAEILEQIVAMNISNRVFIPLEYGMPAYCLAIKKMAVDLFGNRVDFLENRLDMLSYYQRLSHMGYAIFNFRWQEALGNILFLAWNGCKIFLREHSSVYIQFKEWGLFVYSIEQDLNPENLSALLDNAAAQKNRKILEEMFSEDVVADYWKALM